MNKKIKWILVGSLVVVAAVLLFVYLGNKQEKVNFLTETVKRGNITQTVNATGEVNAGQQVAVGAQVSGQIKKLYVVLGQEVNKSDLIAQIDATTQENTLKTERAKLESLKAQLVSKEIALEVATKQYKREQTLLAEDAASHESVENTKDTWAAARSAVAELKSQIRQAETSVNTAEVNLGYTKIVAPFTGIIVSLPVEEGQTVNAVQSTPTIAQIADLSQMKIKMQISEGDITKVKPGLPVTYTILSEPNQVFKTTVASLDPGLTTLTQGSYTGSTDSSTAIYYYARLLVPNEGNKLRIGMTTQNVITVNEAKNVLIIPLLTVHKRQGKSYVRVLRDKDQVEEREISTGLSDGMHIEAVSGLKEGEKVIATQMSASQLAQQTQSSMARPPRM